MQTTFNLVQVLADSKRRRNRQLRMLVPVFLLLVTTAILQSLGMLPGPIVDVEYVYWAAALLVLGGLVYTLAHWRCPMCRKILWFRFNPEYCPGCDVKLRK
jgi:hypothetical protein